MKILFIGQTSLPALSAKKGSHSRASRVETLASFLVQEGHEVAVTCLASHTSNSSINRYKGIAIWRYSSRGIYPIYILTALVDIWRWQPDVVHIHGWLAGLLAPYLSLITSKTTYIWTIDTLPKKYRRIVAWAARNHAIYQAITVPTRQLQYRLLHRYNLRTTYIPDGYAASTITPLAAATFNLRKGQYCLAITNGQENHAWLVNAYKSIKGLKKPLVVITDAEKTGRRTKKTTIFNNVTGRPLASLLKQAGIVVFAEENPNPDTVLHAMDAARPIIATTHPIYEETLGVTAQFIKSGDKKALKKSLESLLKNRQAQTAWGKKAARRAQTFFTWRRSLNEYLVAYYAALVKRVPLDSLQAKAEVRP